MGSRVLSESSLRARVWLVLAYSAVFEFPLSTEEVTRRIWRFAGETFPTQAEIDIALHKLFSMGVIEKSVDLWYLVSQPQAPANRRLWTKNSQIKLQQAAPIISFLAKLPWVVGVAITGSVAVNSAKADDDVDFMIVTEPNRLWLTRLLTLIVAMKYGKRRSFAKEEPNSWCFNLWLTTNSLAVPPERRSLYTAFEVCQAEWLINRHQVAQQFLIDNAWVKRTLVSFSQFRQTTNVKTKQNFEPNIILISLSWLLSTLNGLFFLLQIIYMAPHRTTERVHWDYAWFHPKKKTI
jgi:predicted nucleotidyltransferase